MRLARVMYPVLTLGPGRRLGIWLQGCLRACPGCANPELWNMNAVPDVGIEVIKRTVQELTEREEYPPEGVTITGGEPFMQSAELTELLEYLCTFTSDILLYTGYRREELTDHERILRMAAVVIDGAYIRERNNGHPLKGSDNQRIYYRDAETRQRYDTYIQDIRGRHLTQTFALRQGKAAVGIHESDFEESYRQRIKSLAARRTALEEKGAE